MDLPLRAVPASLNLTKRQVAVLHLVADGESDAEIARTLNIKESTARAHVAQVRDRLLIQYPKQLNGGKSTRPRMVILRYFRFVESAVYGRKEAET